MKLTPNDNDILACMAFDASKSIADVSAALGLKEHVVRHAVKRMLDSDSIRLRPYVSPYALGLMEFYAEIALETPGREALTSLTAALVDIPTSTYVGEVSGDVHLSVMFLARNLDGVPLFFEELCRRVPDVKFTKSVYPVMQLTICYPKSSSEPVGNNALSYEAGVQPVKCDELDAKILVLLGSGKIASRRELSMQCGVAQTTLDYRLKTLQERGILIAMGYTIPAKSDGLFRYSLRVVASRPCAELQALVSELALKHPAVRTVLRLCGRCDYLIDVRLSEATMISPFTLELHRHLGAYVSKIEVLTRLEVHKVYVRPEHLSEMIKLIIDERSQLSKTAGSFDKQLVG